MDPEDIVRQKQLEEIQKKIDLGLAQLEAGQSLSAEESRKRLAQHIEKWKAERQKSK